jgi:hypothetical protein
MLGVHCIATHTSDTMFQIPCDDLRFRIVLIAPDIFEIK